MADVPNITINIANYATVKAVLDAADEVVNAKGDAPWTLDEKIDALESRLAEITPVNNDDEDDGN